MGFALILPLGRNTCSDFEIAALGARVGLRLEEFRLQLLDPKRTTRSFGVYPYL